MHTPFDIHPFPGAPQGFGAYGVNGLNDAGQTLIYSHGPAILQDGKVKPIDLPLPLRDASVTGINNLGVVAGNVNGPTHLVFEGRGGQFSSVVDPLTGRSITEGLNDFGIVVGYNAQFFQSGVNAGGLASTLGWIEQNGHFSTISIPGMRYVEPTAINDFGVVVGSAMDASGHYHAWVDSDGSISILPIANAMATGINNLGEIVGTTQVGADPYDLGFAYFGGHTTTFLPTGASTLYVSGVNDFGQIAGFYGVDGYELPLTLNYIADPNDSTILSLLGMDPSSLGLAAKPSFIR